MSGEMLIRHCSPTLAGLKTGSLFSCDYSDKSETDEEIRNWNTVLVKKGLRMIPLKYHVSNGRKRVLIYVFRVSYLKRDLKENTALRILNDRGYETESTVKCITRLMRRLEECEEFPHEIGLFLGYPPADVEGFIEHKNDGCKCVGYWKVYSDEEKAKKLFRKYKKCTNLYSERLAKGNTIDRLTVNG